MCICLILHKSIYGHFSITDTCFPVGVKAEVTADNTSIRVLWEWPCQGLPLCFDLVRVDYQPEGGSLMMYTVNNTTATSATLPSLQCNTEYTIWVYARSGLNDKRSTPMMVSLPTRGVLQKVENYSVLPKFTPLQSLPLPLRSVSES